MNRSTVFKQRCMEFIHLFLSFGFFCLSPFVCLQPFLHKGEMPGGGAAFTVFLFATLGIVTQLSFWRCGNTLHFRGFRLLRKAPRLRTEV